MAVSATQIQVWLNDNKKLWEFWSIVVKHNTYHLQNKTKEEAIALRAYYKGRYEMALAFTEILDGFNESS